jgi:hypothetical protein
MILQDHLFTPPLGALNWYQRRTLHLRDKPPEEMDPNGKGMVVNDKESLFNEPRYNKPTDSGSSHKKRDEKKKRRIKKIIYYDSDASSSSPRDNDDDDSSSKKRRLIKTTPLIIPVFRITQMPIYFLFLSENPHTFMERITHFGAIRCVVIYFLSILAFWKLWKMGCILIVRIILLL